jgi:PAS domain S-box-containing protein
MTLNKILILRDNLWPDSSQKILETNENIDLLSFDSVNELPQTFGAEIYSGLFILSNKINNDLIEYVKKLRLFKCDQTVFILGNIHGKEVFARILEIENCFLYEKSTHAHEQFILLFNQLQDFSIKQQRFQQNVLNTKVLIANSPEIILTTDEQGKIIDANKSFLDSFKYKDAEVKDKSLDFFIPGYTFEDFLYVVNNPDESNKLVTTFIDSIGQLKPVVINILKSPQTKDHYYIYIKNRSEVLSYKRILDYQNRCFSDLRELFELFFQSSVSDLVQDDFSRQVKKVFNCDFLISCPLKLSSHSNKYVIDFDKLDNNESEIVQVLKSVLESVIKSNEIKVLQFLDQNNAHKEIANYAKTITFIPVYTNKPEEITILLYANRYEPDEFITDIYKILRDILIFSYNQKAILVNSSEKSDNYKEIIEKSSSGIFRTTFDGKLIFANSAFAKILGYRSLDEIKNISNVADVYAKKEERDVFLNKIKEQKNVNNWITRLKNKEGKIISVLEQAEIVSDGNGNQYIEGSLIDISQNEQLENNFSNKRIFANELIEQASIIVIVLDEKGVYKAWNKKAELVSGYKKDEVIGKSNIDELLYPDEKYRYFVHHKFKEYFMEGSGTPIELQLLAKNGKECTISWTATKIKDSDDKDLIAHFGIDLTDVKHLEKRFTETQQMDVFNSVTDKIAQQYKQHISAISKSIGLIKETASVDSFTGLREVEKNLLEAHQFSEHILNLSGQQQITRKEIIDPNEIIDRSIHNILEKTIPNSISIDSQLNSQGYININEAQLNQILLNLVLNSVDAMADGGTINISTTVCYSDSERFLIQNNAVNQEYLKLTCSDSGMGMEPEIKSRIFEPFFTTSGDMTRKGLGATLIFNIIHAANGFINVETKVNKGTQITLYLPLISSQKDVSNFRENINTKILIVDDQKVIREFLKDMANTDGYSTILAEDGQEALKLFERNYKDVGLAIVDIVMPRMYGNELYYKMKEINPELKVLIISGHINEEIKKQLLKDGVDGYLPKPFDVKSTREQIRTLLSN